jgi:hypothetical protein
MPLPPKEFVESKLAEDMAGSGFTGNDFEHGGNSFQRRGGDGLASYDVKWTTASTKYPVD